MEDKAFIGSLLKEHADAMVSFVNRQTSSDFEASPNGKWSVGQNLDHLNKSLSPVNLALQLPSFALRLLFGKPNRKQRNYAELVERYHQKLAAGGTASGPFIPPKVAWNKKEKLIAKFIKETETLNRLMNKCSEDYLDLYLLPHPLLGKITVREMLFFSVYHIQHHLHLLEEREKTTR
jgi:DinB superfamily